MQAESTVHPWVRQFHDRTGFGLQLFPIDTPQQPAQHLLAAGRLAEELVYDAFFIGDHPAWALECWLHLAALADTTQRIRLGSIVNCVSYRHPVMAARQAADLDNLSGGRCILGVGIGWDEHEIANSGLPFPPAAQGQAALEEAIHIIMTGWLKLAEDEARLQAKLAGYFPNGVEERYGGPWAGFVLAGVPASVVPYYQQLVDSGIQYIVVETLDARDQETIRLFAQQVAPRLKPV